MIALGILGKKAVVVPVLPTYDYDFNVLADGALPEGLTGSTYAVSGGKAVNSPTLGDELFTDGSLEATYTDGLCATLTKDGTPTLVESADAHAGSKAQQFTADAADEGVHYGAGNRNGKWLQISGWVKRTDGANGKLAFRRTGNAFPGQYYSQRAIKDAAYTQKIIVSKSYTTNTVIYPVIQQSTGYDTAIVDDFSVKEIPAGEMFCGRAYDSANGTARAYINLDNANGIVGVAARLDSLSNPQNYLMAAVHTTCASDGAEYGSISLAKVVGGTLTVLINTTTVGAMILNGDYIEVVCSGNNVSLYYNGVQIGTTQEVTDAGIVSNTLFGFFGAGGGTINRLTLAETLSNVFTGPTQVVNSTAIVNQVDYKWSGRATMEFNADDELVLIYKRGSTHASDDSLLHIKFSNDYGATWSDEDKDLLGNAITGFPYRPTNVAYLATDHPQEPWLYAAPNGNLILHCWQQSAGTWQSVSTDGGKTWSDGEALPLTGHGGDSVFATDDYFVYDGVIYAAARDFSTTAHHMIFMKSIDNGANWTYISDMRPDGEDITVSEVGIEYIGNNRIIAIFRTVSQTATCRSYSDDMGVTWSQLEAITYNIPASGRHRIMTKKHLEGVANWWEDTNLVMCGFTFITGGRRNALWYSTDAGETWSPPRYCEADEVFYNDGGYGDFVYNATTGQYVFVSYVGALDLSGGVVKQYNLTVTW